MFGLPPPRHISTLPRPCENLNAFPACRRILEKFRIMKLNHPEQIQFDTVLENCFFYISSMYEFSHSLDPKRSSHRDAFKTTLTGR